MNFLSSEFEHFYPKFSFRNYIISQECFLVFLLVGFFFPLHLVLVTEAILSDISEKFRFLLFTG